MSESRAIRAVVRTAVLGLLAACGGVTRTEPPPTFAVRFDGVDDFVQVPAAQAYDYGTADFTVEAWFRRATTGERHEIFSQKDLFNNAGHGVALTVDGADGGSRVYGYLMQRPYTDTDVRLVSRRRVGTEWTHVALTRADSVMTLYVDGVEEARAVRPPFDLTSDGPLRIGANRPEYADADAGARFAFRGLIYEVRVWSVARTPEQIRAAMYQRLDGSEPGLEHYFPFDEGRGSTTWDVIAPRSASLWGAAEWRCATPLPGETPRC